MVPGDRALLSSPHTPLSVHRAYRDSGPLTDYPLALGGSVPLQSDHDRVQRRCGMHLKGTSEGPLGRVVPSG
eukprot:3940841-Rhodomonas_salina.2